MGLNIIEKIINSHLLSGTAVPGEEIMIEVDQTLTQDSTGTMAYLQLEALDVPKVKTKKSVAYIDHNMLQSGFENADDHKYIQTVANKHGVYFSRPGNGICHQVHLERFSIPGMVLIGSDSHTPTCGGIGMLSIGAGGMDVAVAMGGGRYSFTMPKVLKVNLKGSLHSWVSAKDIILELLRRLSVRGGVGYIIEYSGPGIKTLQVPQRATICNMGAELGATSSIFPSDEITRSFLKAQKREQDWIELLSDNDAEYADEITIDLSELEPLAAMPHSPDKIAKVKALDSVKVDQVAIGSCTNSSYNDMMNVARILKGKTIGADVSLVISPGSKQVLTMLAENGALADIIRSGARILESSCGPCIGMGQAPASNAISLRTFNRNFEGRCGTKSAQVYLVSPETAVASALAGRITDPRTLEGDPILEIPSEFTIDDSLIVPPAADGSKITIVKGPNIKPFPVNNPLPDVLEGIALVKVGDNITTDHIIPSNADLLPFRSNIPYLSKYCLTPCDPLFPQKAHDNRGGFIIGGENYGQGSSREHAALVPLQLGIKGVIAKSFARIHMANLINAGIIPMTFINDSDYEKIAPDDLLVVDNLLKQMKESEELIVYNKTKSIEITVKLIKSKRQTEILLAGGLLNYTKMNNHKSN